jgi:hypothetical protein
MKATETSCCCMANIWFGKKMEKASKLIMTKLVYCSSCNLFYDRWLTIKTSRRSSLLTVIAEPCVANLPWSFGLSSALGFFSNPRGPGPSRNRAVVPDRQDTKPGGIGSLESILGLLKSSDLHGIFSPVLSCQGLANFSSNKRSLLKSVA